MKTIQIEPSNTLEEVQAAFKSAFPLLDIKFFQKGHNENEGNLKENEIENYKTKLSSINNSSTTLSIDGHKKVSTLEADFEALGIHAQVFRKSGNVYIQTTTTDHLTLAEQEKQAHD